MSKPDFTQFSLPLRKDIQQLEKLKYWEISAEQLIQYLSPNMGKQKLLQILMIFELGKVYYGLRALFNNNQLDPSKTTNPKHEARKQFNMKLLNEKRKEILELSQRSKI